MKMPISVGQAAVFCGGIGSRLRPLTDKMPKPMVPVNGYPFLFHLLTQLKENGIRKVILMTGYLGSQISDYFKDGRSMGLDITYSHGPVEWETGRRLFEIKNLLDEHFMLAYSDNFVPYNHEKNLRFYFEQKKILSFIVQAKAGGNIRLGNRNTIAELYDKTRTAEGLNFVELGYMISNKEVFRYYDDIDVSFSDIIAKLVKKHQVAALEVKDKYYSISDMERLKLTEEYLKPKKIFLVDRDGVINKRALKGEYITSWKDFYFIKDNVEALEELSKAGNSFIVISNQAGIARGVVSAEDVNAINQRMKDALEKRNIRILGVYVCPHHWNEKCFCRKPEPGLFFQASRDFMFRLDKSYYIGDDSRDCQAAYKAGCRCIYTGDKEELKSIMPEERPDVIARNLKEAIPYLEAV